MSIYLDYNKWKESENKENVINILQTMRKFQEWSGLKINLDKTYLVIFGEIHKKHKFVDELKIKWRTEFKLLGIYFDVTLSKMQVNYERAVDAVKKELYSWKHRFLSVFRKITVIKTKTKSLCLSSAKP